ncbi:MAG TPA: TlpA disulfide reductase family protein [Rhizomicrobium sp.]|jgi:thiol-disulfide isomerase/thioredoxin
MPRSKIWIVAVSALVVLGAAVALVLYGMGGAQAKPPAALATLAFDPAPKPIPEVAFADETGARHTLEAFKGRYVLLNLWATWCAPCVKELPALSRLQASLPQAKFAVVTVNVGRGTAADTATFLKTHDAANLPVYMDSNAALLRTFGEGGLPMSILIDPQGREVARAADPADWDNADAIAYFKKLTAS